MPRPISLPGLGGLLGTVILCCGVDLDGVVRLVGVGIVLDGVLGGTTLFRLGIGLDT